MAIPRVHTVLLTRRLADLATGGLTLHHSLDVLRRQSEHREVRNLLKDLTVDLENGQSFSQALAGKNGNFSPIYVGMVRSGESSGNLEAALNELAQLMESEMDIRNRIRSAFAYPCFLILLAAAVCIFLTGFVIPRFEFLFQDLGQRLPWPTRFLISFSLFLKSYGAIALGIASLAGFAAWKKATMVRQHAQRFLLSVPVLSDILRGSLIERWSQIMASLLRSGYTVSDALTTSRQSMGSPLLSHDLLSVSQKVREGRSLGYSLSSTPFFPAMVGELASAGEESGQLDITFSRLASAYRRETELKWKMLLSFLEPALILGMGAVVGFVAVAMLLPIFQMSANLK